MRKSLKSDIPYLSAALGYYYSQNNKFDSAIFYYKKTLTNPGPTPTNVPLVASSLNGIGYCYSEQGITDSAIWYYRRGLKLYASIKDTVQAASIETNLAIIYKDRGLYGEALEYAFGAINVLEKLHPVKDLGSCYNTVSLVYYKTGEFSGALEFSTKALTIRRTIKNTRGVGMSYNTIGEIYLSMKKYDSALINLQRAIVVKQSINDRKSLASTFNNIGIASLESGALKEAEEYFRDALVLKKKFKDKIGEAITLNNLGRLYLTLGDFIQSEKYLNEAAVLIRESGALEQMRENLEIKMHLYWKMKNFSHALQISEELLVIRDSLLSVEKAQSLLALQLHFDTDEKNQQIVLLEKRDHTKTAELRNKQTLIYALWTGLILLVAVFGLAYNNLRLVRKGKRSVELLVKEMHHRMKNNLQILTSLFVLQSQHLTDENAIQAVKSSESRVAAMALIHKKLYDVEQNRGINIKEYITELVLYLIQSYAYGQKEFKFNLEIEEITIDVDKVIPLGLIINEIVSNAFKYAYQEQNKPELNVNLSLRDKKDLLIEIRDNGSGIPDDVELESPRSFGLKMVKLLIRDLRGHLDIRSGNGTVFFLNIPLSQ